MTMKKNMNSERMRIVSNAGQGEIFPVNFKYVLGQDIYTVKDAYVSDNTEMRTIVSDKGEQMILTVSSLIKDTKEANFKILDDGIEKESEKESEKENKEENDG